jgi:protein-disulfide isomerase
MSCRLRSRVAGAAVLSLCHVCLPAYTQTADERFQILSKEIEALKGAQKAMQTELEAIKALLTPKQPLFQPVDINVGGAPALGAANAKVTLVEFTDYQCPFCAKQHSQTLPQIIKEYIDTGKVKYVVRDLPLESIHSFALQAAQAARCAEEQGKFWEMHDKLFAGQSALSPEQWLHNASALDLDTDQFKTCIQSGKYVAAIRQSAEEASNAGARGTPATFIGLTKSDGTIKAVNCLNGAHTYGAFKKAIDSLLAEAPPANHPAHVGSGKR